MTTDDDVVAIRYFRKPGQPRWPKKVQEHLKDIQCEYCQRKYGEHSLEEFNACRERKFPESK